MPVTLPAATLTVTTTADSGAGSLRQAILDSNASAGVLDTIAFAIPGAGPHTLAPASALPMITDPAVIDGTTQPGYAGAPLIEIDATNAGSALSISAGSSTVRGLALNRSGGAGVLLQTLGGNVVEGNFIGTDPTGTQDFGNSEGVYIFPSSDGNRIGGPLAAQRNVISGNGRGIVVVLGSMTLIQGNFIGTTAAGDAPLFNSYGISIDASAVTIGGGAPGQGNLISGNFNGIQVESGDGLTVLGNRIGTDATGTEPLGNSIGINAVGSTTNLVIGGAAPGEGNLISANGTGVVLDVSGAIVQGNVIGADATGTSPLGNAGPGVSLAFTATTGDNVIGGIAPGEGNLIAYNGISAGTSSGIFNVTQRNPIRGNSIHSNVGLGIDNNEPGALPGVTPNDPGDADTGGNGIQNFPILTSVEIFGPQGGGTRIQGVLRSMASTTYDLDFYENPACTAFPREFLEGQTYIGSGQVVTDGSGEGAFDVTLPAVVAAGARITATATDPTGNTSEFSQRIVFSMAPASGPAAGGGAVTISGTDFGAGAAVTIGGVAAGNVQVVGNTSITATTPVLTAGASHDVVVTNTDATAGTLIKGWVSDFLDVPGFHQFYSFVTTLVSNGITAGIGGGFYGVDQSTLRQQMAVFLLKAKYGLCYVPPNCAGTFTDVACPSTFAAWIEDLAEQGITGGCGAGVYCPQNPVRRDQMAVFLLKAKYGSGYTPPPCTGVFPDVTCPSQFADWIEQLADEAITGGCGGGNYCPLNPNTRGQMAVFIVKTFVLQ